MEIKYYGWKPDLPDIRDIRYHVKAPGAPLATVMLADKYKIPEVFDQGNLGSCFPAGTFIRMADGSQKQIQDIRLLDEVLTAEGNIGPVKQTMVRMETDGLLNVILWGNNLLRLTKEHPILTKRGYVKAGEIQVDDWAALPKYSVNETETFSTDVLLAKKHTLIKRERKIKSVLGRKEVCLTMYPVPKTLKLTYSLGKLLGLFLAEGSTDYGKIRFTFGSHEEDTLVAETVKLIKDELDMDAYVQHRPNNSINIVIYGMDWSNLFKEMCGNGAGYKRLHPSLTKSNQLFKEGILEGWLQGDGWYRKKKGNNHTRCGITISHELALNMYDIAQNLGKTPVINWSNPVNNSAARTRKKRWIIEIGSRSDNWRVEQTENTVYRKVRAIEKEDFIGYVYNLSVEGDESYVAEGIGVHNCTGNAIASAIAFDIINKHTTVKGDPKLPLSRLFIYYNERVIEQSVPYDDGAMIRDGIKTVAREGVCSEKMWPYHISQFAKKPPKKCYTAAIKYKALEYQRIDNTDKQAMWDCLNEGYPFVIGFSVYDSFESSEVERTGIVPMPSATERLLGGHCVFVKGYDVNTDRFTCQNSWGLDWGIKGDFTIPAAYLMHPDLADDFWTIRVTQ